MTTPLVEYLASAHKMEEMLPDSGREVAFAGRSNAGKSSAINALANRHRLAFVSKTPGRTQTINFFSAGKNMRWVDLPGYGFAKVSKTEREYWGELISAYLTERSALIGLILLADSRHGIKPLDEQLIRWFAPTGRPVHVLLTKSDKLSQSAASTALRDTQTLLTRRYANCSVQLFSATANRGVVQANALLAEWLTSQDERTEKTPG
ncbi:MAG TPA: ribosome biogenesis GTP-binding protein YihA/YsxC [Burkholderiales bacterium]|nr:ribosome biogenesis GTP-binding protein YihA/YsxC [Burkholderiales bacterium]